MVWEKAPNKEEPDSKGHNLFWCIGKPQKRKIRGGDPLHDAIVKKRTNSVSYVAPAVRDHPRNAKAYKKPPVQDQSSPQLQFVYPFAACFFFDGESPFYQSMSLLWLDALFAEKFHVFCEYFVNKYRLRHLRCGSFAPVPWAD